MHVRYGERLENKQVVTSVKGERDKVMLMGCNCSLIEYIFQSEKRERKI